MEWKDNGAGEDLEADDAFVVIHKAPPLQAVQHKQTKSKAPSAAAAALAATERELELGAFPPLFTGESEDHRLGRAAAAERCWAELDNQIQVTLDQTDEAVFHDLLQFARQHHRAPGTRPPAAMHRRLPTALVLAGGVNSADHCTTFPNLAGFLRRSGCRAALLSPATFGRFPGDAVGEILRQLSGRADSREELLDDLVHWYREETGVPPPEDPFHPFQAAQPATTAAAEAADPGESAASGHADADARQLRARGAARPTPAQQAARAQPLVVVVEGTEGVDARCLRDFIACASEVYQDLPLTLVLGLTTTAAALHSLLDSEVIDRCMELHHFKLATALSRLNSLVRRVLLGGGGAWPGLLFSQRIVSRLIDSFLNHFFSTGCIRQGLKVAALEHFRSQPLSGLAASALQGPAAMAAACAELDATTLREAKRLLSVRSTAQLAEVVAEALAGWARWAVGLHWLLEAAAATGLHGTDVQPWRLIEDALRPTFAAQDLPPLWERIEMVLRRLPPTGVQRLAARLAAAAEAVPGGVEAAAELLEQLAPFAAEGGTGVAKEEKENEQQQEQQQQQQRGAAIERSAADEEGEEEAAEAELPGRKQKRKRDKFHSKQSRQEALLQKAAAAAAKGGTSAAAAAAAQRERQAAPGARFAAWLASALADLLATPPVPSQLPGAAVFTCCNVAALDCLTSEPRAALHSALTEPHLFLRGLPADMGTCAGQEDAALAYTLFDQDPACANLADWYAAFAAVHGELDAADDAGAGVAGDAGPSKPRKAAVKRSKKRTSGRGADEGDRSGGEEQNDAEKKRRQELAARFSQATAELQYVGLIKPARRRRGDYVQRVVHMPAANHEHE